MPNETLTLANDDFAIINYDKAKTDYKIVSNILALNIWLSDSLNKFGSKGSSNINFPSTWLKKPKTIWQLAEMNNAGAKYWHTLFMHKTQKYVDQITIDLFHRFAGDSHSYTIFIQLLIKKLHIQLGPTNDRIYLYKDTQHSNNSTETVTLKTGSGNDTIYKEGICKDKNTSFHLFRYYLNGQDGEDRFEIYNYGINFLNGGKNKDCYDITVRKTEQVFHTKCHEINKRFKETSKTFSLFYKTLIDLYKTHKKYLINGKQNPPYMSYTGLTFISDYSQEDNELNVSISHWKAKKSNASNIFISTSRHLHKKTAEKISSKFFVILKIGTSFIIFYPQTLTEKIKIHPYKEEPITLYLGKKDHSAPHNKKKTFYDFNKLPKNFNYRKYRVQLKNHATYQPIESFKKVAGKKNTYDISNYIQ